MSAEQQLERVDPRPRSVSRAFLGRVVNPDENRVYCLANPNEDAFGYAAMEADGWQPLVKGCKEKVTGARVAPDGTNRFMVQGQIVMWRPKAEQDAYLDSKHGFAAAMDAEARRQNTVEVVDGNRK